LGYTEVRAPISGRISEPLIKLGNLVENGTLLANITDSREVFVNFSVNDRDALRFLQRQRQGGISDEQSRARWEEQAIYLSTEVDTGFPHVGVLDYVDQTGVDPTTGTLGLRARFPNPEGILLPGTFVRLRIVSAEATEAILLPETCVLQDSKRTYVLTLDRQNVVSETEIRVREKVDGWVIVSAGLDETTLVIVEGLQKAQQNKPVTPEKIDLKPTDFWLGETSQGGEKGANLTEPGTAAGRDF
jgi:RND family efflux transporter MFP subunit